MIVKLSDRTEEQVIEFFNKTQNEEIQRLFPFSVSTLEASMALYHKSLKADATSFGKTIIIDETYVGDVWVYGIDEEDERMAMLSIVIFDKNYWGLNIGPKVITEFLQIVFDKYQIDKVGAFTYAANTRSIRALEKSGYAFMASFVENHIESRYYEYRRK